MTHALTNDSARAMWTAFLLAHAAPGHRFPRLPAPPAAWAFGSGAVMETELAELVVSGTKRATAASLDAMLYDGDDMPQVGDHSIILDGVGVARCIIQTTEVACVRLGDVSAEFAAHEGEGDGSLAYWMDAHRGFFSQEHAERQLPFNDEIPVVLERFMVIWPPELCDA